jgi:amino acid adenylation domain-containing protein
METNQSQPVQLEMLKDGLSDGRLQRYVRAKALQREKERIRPRPEGAPVPLSPEQRGIWLHASQQPDLPIYNEPFTIHRHGSFDLGILEASVNEIVRRHEAWRSSFSSQGEQVIHDSVRVTLHFLDLSGLPPAERETEALRLATEDAQKPIPLHAAPLFRSLVVRMQADEHRLYLTFHHIIFDAISIYRIFVPELSEIYASFERGEGSPLPPPPLQYGDYAIWREQDAESPAVERQLADWHDQLSGELPILRLPQDRPRPAIASHRGSMECFHVPDELMEKLLRLSQERGVTLYTTLLAAFKVLLFRYSGQNDLIVGTATDARRRPELEFVMGYFIGTFAIRTQPASELCFSEYLAQTQGSLLRGLDASEVPFDRVVQEVNPKRNTSHHPIFQAFFSVPPPMPSFPEGWDLTEKDVAAGTSKFDLYLELSQRLDRTETRFFYSTDIWDASTIRRMAAHWLVLLESVCRNPETTLGMLSILTPEDTAALVGPGGWNDTSRAFPQKTLTALIEDQVFRTPHSIAAAFDNERWTYEELNSRAEAIAALLRTVGVTRGSTVAIVLDRSLNLLAALIAVLKTGAAYLPLDIETPGERLALCLADAKPAVILAELSTLEQVASTANTAVIVLGNRETQRSVATDALSAEPAQITNDLEDTAYSIYTSGTTGEPKAVEISHRSLVNLLAAMQTSPGFGPEDVFLAVTPISFDIAALELFLPLICGGMTVIASREEARDPYLLASAISSSGCTVMQATPATWRTLLLSGWDDAGWNNARPSSSRKSSRMLRVLCGGEALPWELANRLLATGAELWNMYGPTETTVWSLIHHVRVGAEKEEGLVSIGCPIANTTAYILDGHLQPLPIGVPGELFLGGVGLSKGYRGRPQQTADRFIEVQSVGGLRLYRTGDIAVRRKDRTIEVLGRTDNQVKVRGYRVELEAVEAAVLRHPHVAAAVARVWPEPTGGSRLSVYVVARDEALAPSLADMRSFLSSSLPDSMIPSDVIPLPTIPLTPHGKVDRARLPSPPASGTRAPRTTPSSRSPQEARLAAIWADLLGWQHVGLDDNFFDLGGHSLLVAALQQRIATGFGQRIPMAELFHSPTVRQQVELAQRLVKGEPALPPGVFALQPNGTGNGIFWVHYLNAKLAKAIGDEHPFLVVALTTEDFSSLGETPTLQSIAACLVRKILVTQSKEPYTIGGQCAGGILAYEIASQLQAAGHKVSLLVLLDAPNLSYARSQERLARKLSYPRYLLNRAARLGLRTSSAYIGELLHNRITGTLRTKSARTEMRVAQEMIEAAASDYEPERYEGKTLLVLASDRPPHRNYLAGWQAIVLHNLHTQYVDGHHREFLNLQNVRAIADGILSQLTSSTDDDGGSMGGM